MAESAFKSTSRRLNAPGTVEKHRRSRSVCASPRNHPRCDPSDFSNKRDNPLFSTCQNEAASTVERGRSVSRADTCRKGIESSLSRIERRDRSVSRQPSPRFGNSKSDVEHTQGSSVNKLNRNNSNLSGSNERKANLIQSWSNLSDKQLKSPAIRSSDLAPLQPTDDSASRMHTPTWEDAASSNSFSDAEEKTIKAVFEQTKNAHIEHENSPNGIYETVRYEVRRAISDIQNDLESTILRRNATDLLTTNISEIPPDLVNPAAVELVLDIRREYARKLNESKERARKLRADLSVEEYRGKELSRILKDILPDPKSSNVQKSNSARRASMERRKMSKRLTKDAMAYFDECVSISTFDSSDFSAPEDLPTKAVETSTLVAESPTLTHGSVSVSSSTYIPNKSFNYNQLSLSPISVQASNTESSTKLQFSFSKSVGIRQDIRNYVKNFEKGIQKVGEECGIAKSSYYNAGECVLNHSTERLLCDRVLYEKRVETGSLLLCAGGTGTSFSLFASIV